ncbi:MAG: flavoprotein [Candidatus Kaelpia aquatica]|nr:flavoprotein [Candidatus Kaelpia aquatica]
MKTVLLGVTGSIASYKAADIASKLTQQGCKVYALLTENAKRFITPLTFKALTGQEVFDDMFKERQTHISLAEEADLILVAPASAGFISKLASGIVSELLQLTIISSSAPLLICPAMNENMYRNSIIQENIARLKKHGYNFLGPDKGWLSCGNTGEGRLCDIEDILKKSLELLK